MKSWYCVEIFIFPAIGYYFDFSGVALFYIISLLSFLGTAVLHKPNLLPAEYFL